jgi:hypothetical protein
VQAQPLSLRWAHFALSPLHPESHREILSTITTRFHFLFFISLPVDYPERVYIFSSTPLQSCYCQIVVQPFTGVATLESSNSTPSTPRFDSALSVKHHDKATLLSSITFFILERRPSFGVTPPSLDRARHLNPCHRPSPL